MSTLGVDIHKLAPEERLRLIEELWESLRATPESVPITPAQLAELDRRLDELDRGEVGLVPGDEVDRQLTTDRE